MKSLLFFCFYLVAGTPLAAKSCAPCALFKPFAPVAPNLLEERDLYKGLDGELEIGLGDFLDFGGFLSFPSKITGKVKAGYQDRFTSPQIIQFINSCKCNHYTAAIGKYTQIDMSLPEQIRKKELGLIMIELGQQSEACVEKYLTLLSPVHKATPKPSPPQGAAPRSPSPPHKPRMPPPTPIPCSPLARVEDKGSAIVIHYNCNVLTTAFIRYQRIDRCHDDVKERVIHFKDGRCKITKASLGYANDQKLLIEVYLTPKNEYQNTDLIGSSATGYAR